MKVFVNRRAYLRQKNEGTCRLQWKGWLFLVADVHDVEFGLGLKSAADRASGSGAQKRYHLRLTWKNKKQEQQVFPRRASLNWQTCGSPPREWPFNTAALSSSRSRWL